jgi:hypothetical protein
MAVNVFQPYEDSRKAQRPEKESEGQIRRVWGSWRGGDERRINLRSRSHSVAKGRKVACMLVEAYSLECAAA